MIQDVGWFWVTLIDGCYRIIRTALHYLLAVAYWSRGRTVPPINDPILKTSATDLAKQIREGKLTSEAVVRAFIKRIVEVDPIISATAERRFDDALHEAREVDALVASGSLTRKQMAEEKPFLGVPFTVKVIFAIKGLRCTACSLLYRELRSQEDAPSVALMKKAGAIVLTSTNMPEFGLNLESTNYMYGTTCNPYDTSRTSGGSSGGESALVAAAGSVIGIGNDFLGSIRIPCMFTGLFGHKPTRGLVPDGGCFPTPHAKVEHFLHTGPMCRYAIDLVTSMKVFASQSEKIVNFSEQVSLEGLKVFYLFSFGKMPLVEEPNKDMKDAVRKAVSHFEAKYNLKAQQVNIPLLRETNNLVVHAVMPTTNAFYEKFLHFKGILDATLEMLKLVFRQSKFTFGPLFIPHIQYIRQIYDENKVEHYRKLAENLEDQFNRLLDDRSILVLPTLPFPAPYHHEAGILFGSICYSSIFNVFGLPSTQCPMGLNKNGLPVGIQIVSRKRNDPLTIACAIELEKTFGGWIPPK